MTLHSAEPHIRPYRRDRAIGVAIILLLVAATIAYPLAAENAAMELRKRHALDRNVTTAKLSARLLDEQWADVVSVGKVLAQQRTLEKALRQNDRRGLQRSVRDVVDLVPALVYAAAYRLDGTQVTAYPAKAISIPDARNLAWFRRLAAGEDFFEGDVMRFPDEDNPEVVPIATRLGSKTDPAGYLMSYYRLGDMNEWLRQLRMSGGVLYVVSSNGRMINSSDGAHNRSMGFMQYPAFRKAISGEEGAEIARAPGGGDDAIVGYAYARRPAWAVLVVQPVDIAYAPSTRLLSRLGMLGGVCLALLGMSALALDRLARRQNTMAKLLSGQNDRLRKADRAKSDFLANVSHDLRTPLAGVQLSISGLLDTGVNWRPDQVRESLRVASVGLDQLNGRVRNLLEMARIEADVWPLHKMICDLTDVVGSALERMQLMTAGREIVADFPEAPLLLDCDPAQVETAIVNLVENAIKYSPAGAPLHLRGEVRGAFACFLIRDHGAGVAPEDELRIFEKFYRAESSRSSGGTGLGLAICHAIVEAHGGEIGVTRPSDGGAEFWFCLPAEDAAERGLS